MYLPNLPNRDVPVKGMRSIVWYEKCLTNLPHKLLRFFTETWSETHTEVHALTAVAVF